jgi:hypothetical protein
MFSEQPNTTAEAGNSSDIYDFAIMLQHGTASFNPSTLPF